MINSVKFIIFSSDLVILDSHFVAPRYDVHAFIHASASTVSTIQF